jgi:hypothetical protein
MKPQQRFPVAWGCRTYKLEGNVIPKWAMNGLIVVTISACLGLMGCAGKKGHCGKCSNNSDCSSGDCATFVTSSGDRFFACSNGSSTDTCSNPN